MLMKVSVLLTFSSSDGSKIQSSSTIFTVEAHLTTTGTLLYISVCVFVPPLFCCHCLPFILSKVLCVCFSREALAPFLKNEEARLMAESAAPSGPFQYILCAATSPAVKQQDESLTYLNQGEPLSSWMEVLAQSR